MNGILVTLKSNVETDLDGKLSLDEDGEIIMKNESDVGILTKTHLVSINQVDSQGNIIAGIVGRAEVYWNEKRNPAPALEDPADLVWLSGTTLGGEESEEQDENEDVEQDPVDVNQEEFAFNQ